MRSINNFLLHRYKLSSLGAKALGYLRLFRQKIQEKPHHPLTMDKANVFAEFVGDNGEKTALYEGYRDRIKSSWRSDHWATIALLNVKNRVQLPSETVSLVEKLLSGRTLPASLEEFADAVTEIAQRYPHELSQSDILCPLTQRSVIAAPLTEQQVDSIAQSYQRNASSKLRTYILHTRKQVTENITTLEVGCGMGYAVVAMAGLGVAYSAGIDYATVDYRSIDQRPRVLSRLGIDDPSLARRVQIIPSDMHHMPFDDNHFDLMYSSSVLEHVHDLESGFAEMARVLKPGGIMIHGVDPYFSPRGGHASCTLDFPWGHARLSSSEFRRYIQEFRPYEYDHAMKMYEYLFNRPRVSLHEIEQFIGQAGLSILSWQEHWRSNHLPSSKIWREVNSLYPSVSMRDLAVDGLHLVLIKQ